MLTIFLALIAWYATRVVKRFERLVDDRLIMASDSMVGFREFGVCLELFRPQGVPPGSGKPADGEVCGAVPRLCRSGPA